MLLQLAIQAALTLVIICGAVWYLMLRKQTTHPRATPRPRPSRGSDGARPLQDPEEAASGLPEGTSLAEPSNSSDSPSSPVRKTHIAAGDVIIRESIPESALNELTVMISEFPPLPINTTRILGELRSESVNNRKMAELVSQDPMLSTAVLRMANSVFAAQSTEVTSIERSVLLLGYDTVLAVALRGAMAGLITRQRRGGFDSQTLVRHNVATGLLAGALAKIGGRVDPGEAITAGLLHDLGKIILNVSRPEIVENILDPSTTRLGESRLGKEQRLLGANHAIIGAMLASQWHLPPTLVSTIELHHHPAVTALESYTPRIRELTGMVFVANQLSKMLGYHGDDREIDLPSDELLPSLGLANHYDAVIADLPNSVQRTLKAFLGEAVAA